MLDFFSLPFSSAYHFGNFLQLTIFLSLPALAAIFSLKTNALNLGGEGQIFAGGLFSTAILLQFPNPTSNTEIFFVLLLSCIVAIFVGGMIAFISGWLLEKTDFSEVVSSYLISSACIPICDYLLGTVFLDKSQNLVASKKIAEYYQSYNLLTSSNLNSSIFFILAIFVLAIIFFYFTKYGHILTLTGKGDRFVTSAGFHPKKNRTIAFTISGALNGLTGFFAITGMYFSVHSGFYTGISWNALTIALLCNNKVAFLLIASFAFAYLQKCVDNAALQGIFTINTGNLIKGVLLFILGANAFLKTKFKRLEKNV